MLTAEQEMTTLGRRVSLTQLTHSSESCFRTCPRKYQLMYSFGLRPSHDNDALRIGHAFHAGLEVLKGGGTENEAANAIRAQYAEADCPPWLMPEDFATEQEIAVAMATGWARRYADDGIVRYVAVEISFDLPLINPFTGREFPGYRNAGKIDGIAELPDGRLALVEHKTAGEDIAVDADYWKRLMLDSQISRYYLAAQSLGYNVETVIYDAIRKPLVRPKAISKADRAMATSRGNYFGVPLTATCPERETPKLFAARLIADMAERPDWYFRRVEIPRLKIDLDDFRRDQWATLKSLTQCEIDDYYPRNTSACTIPYSCTFLDVCRGMRGDPNEQIPEGFRRVDNLHPELTPAQPVGAELCPQ